MRIGMRGYIRRGFIPLAATFLLTFYATPLAGSARADTTPMVTGTRCVGNNDTLSWAPPSFAVLGYRVVTHNTVFPQSPSLTYDLPADQTSLQFPVQFGMQNLVLYAYTQSGYTQLASVNDPGSQKPQPMQWDSYSDGKNKVGDGFVTVAFFYIAESIYFDTGNSNVTVTVTASPGGATITSQAELSPDRSDFGVTDTFTGLTNGVHYTFVSEASNDCGSSGPSLPSDKLTPIGVPVTTTTSVPVTTTTSSVPVTTTTVPAGLTCVVTGTAVPPAVAKAQQYVQVQAPAGLNAISNIHIVNGVVNVATYTPGTTAPVVVTATKSVPGQTTTWSFDMTDIQGHTRHCG
jgi:hypothetical protein